MKKQLNYKLILLLASASWYCQGESLRDPTQPQVSPKQSFEKSEKKKSALKLQSIFTKQGKRIAIISGQLLKVGEKINGYRVNRILANAVELKRDTEKLKLELYNYEIKR